MNKNFLIMSISVAAILLIVVSIGSATMLVVQPVFAPGSFWPSGASQAREPNQVRPSTPSISNFLIYENSTNGFRIQYPSNWEKQEESNPLFSGVQFVFRESGSTLGIAVGNTTIGSLDEFTDIRIKSLSSSLSKHLIDSRPTRVSGIPAHEIVYQTERGQHIFKALQIWFIVGDRLYNIIYLTDPSEYEIDLSTVKQIIDSFQVINANAVPASAREPANLVSTGVNAISLIRNAPVFLKVLV